MIYPNSYASDSGFRPGDFVISSVNAGILKKYGIDGTVKDFKDRVKKSRNYKVIVTGGAGYSCHTRVYNSKDFVKPTVQPTKVVNSDYWWNNL